jgi:large subunit ribosomal protein L20
MRVKAGTVTRRRHKKILKMTSGQWGTRSTLFRRANEAMMKSYWYAYRDRRNRRRDFPVCGLPVLTRLPAPMA